MQFCHEKELAHSFSQENEVGMEKSGKVMSYFGKICKLGAICNFFNNRVFKNLFSTNRSFLSIQVTLYFVIIFEFFTTWFMTVSIAEG